MDIHPLCAILPSMPANEYKPLVEDIRHKGLIHPIITFEEKILDGRHRFLACNDAGVTPRFEEYSGNDPAGYVASSCLHRSLTTGQRALIAVGFKRYESEQAKLRQGTRTDLGKDFPVNCSESSAPSEARERAGARMGVSGASVERAERVLKNGSPELVEQVRSGKMTVSAADSTLDVKPSLRKPLGVRLGEILKLAEEGYNGAQIAEKIGLSPERVSELALANNIEITAQGKRSPRINYRRVVEQTVAGLEASAAGLRTLPVHLSEFTKEETHEWAASVSASIKQFTAFLNQLKGHSNAHH